MFRVVIEKPEPNLVKLSRKNVAFITITANEEEVKAQDDQVKMIEYFMAA